MSLSLRGWTTVWKRKGIVAVTIFGFLLTGCNGGGGGGPTATEIQNSNEGAAAVSAGISAATAGAGVSEIAASLSNLTKTALGKPTLSRPTHPLVSRDPRYAKINAMINKVAKSKVINKVAKSRTIKNAAVYYRAIIPLTPLTAMPIDSAEDCSFGGNYTISGIIDKAIGEHDVRIVFNNCREEEMELNGPVKFDGQITEEISGFTAALGDETTDFTGQAYSDSTYNTVVAEFTANLALNVNSETSLFESTSATTSGLFLNGSVTFEDSDTEVSLKFNSFKDTGSFTSSLITSTFDDTRNGGISVSWSESGNQHDVDINYNSFKTRVEASGVFVASPTTLSHDSSGSANVSFSGTVSIFFDPDIDCEIEGTFNFVTKEDLHFGPEDNCPVSGQIVINGNTTVDYGVSVHDSSEGHVDVTVGGETRHFDTCDELDGLCEIVNIFEELVTLKSRLKK